MKKQKRDEKYRKTAEQLEEEVKTGRDISACLGSVGLTFTSDITSFAKWCDENEFRTLAYKILNAVKFY